MNDQDYMRLALKLARSTVGQTAPNPVVGAVVVKDGTVAGIGAHLKAGEAHAEVHALSMAGEKAKGATIYVTLEPCSHYGKTPPCADLIVKSGIKRAVIATGDPNPDVAGRGLEKLREVGIAVEFGVCQKEADELNRVFFHFLKHKRPFVTLKAATTLDGKTATVAGKSKWITSAEARADAHYYRHTHDAILVGVNTVLADDPSLTTRLENGGKNPIRIVLDRQLRTPLEAKIVQDQLAPTWLITTEQAPTQKEAELKQLGVKVIRLKELTVRGLLELLGREGVTSLFVEGGAEVNGSFLVEKAIDQMIVYLAPKVFGGSAAPSSIGGAGIAEVADVPELNIIEVTTIGPDIKIRAVKEGE